MRLPMRLTVTLSRRMDDGQYVNLIQRLVHLIDDDVWRLEQLPGSLNQSWAPDMGEPRQR